MAGDEDGSIWTYWLLAGILPNSHKNDDTTRLQSFCVMTLGKKLLS